ncbi:myb-like protein O [Teleopsis dalmanni]|uniref:myb-like protein O n=1 Tax=Teleopsis dalmanni TaxID=139649 RepID=UPI0018CF0FBE|nr:myb-like protein O [Teleopsis dalmanni]
MSLAQQYFEDSPLSDSKMDISDYPSMDISLDSTGASPEGEDDAVELRLQIYENQNNGTEKVKNTQNEDDIKNIVSLKLDNRIARPEILLLDTTTQGKNIANRTLANSHPLMSPNGTDSESERTHNRVENEHKCHNFPDVVPRNEHLPLQVQSNAFNFKSVNVLAGKGASAPTHNKLALLRTHSPDLLSSESEADNSQYHASVESNFQAVALVPNVIKSNSSKCAMNSTKFANLRIGCEDISSLDSISNHSFDENEDIEHNLASLSPSSSMDGLDMEDDDDDDDDDCEGPELLPDGDDDDFDGVQTPTPNIRNGSATNMLPQYTADEERRDSRNWQKITLPDGSTREIDMRVIEPYKRVLSHGGYLKAGGQNAIVIFCACHLPDRSRTDYNYVMDNLFLYVVKTLEQLVTDDYILIYLHGGSNRRNVPPFPWLKRWYQLLDRRLRKSLKNLYLVHPTFWIKSIVWMARPFVSAKFWRKLIYVKSLQELGTHVAVEKAAIPEKVKQYDAKHN